MTEFVTTPGSVTSQTRVSPDGAVAVPPSGQPILRVEGLTKRFGTLTAVNNLSFEVHAGEVLGFLGPNGSGKSTTVSMILGLVRPTAGQVYLFGQPVRDHPEIVSQRVGAIIENPAFYPYLSGRDNLRALARNIGGVSDQRVEELLRLVNMTDRAKDKYKTYSLGMKQRLGIASTLLNNPALVILDEPTNGLDPAGQREIREFIPQLAANGHAVLLASHLLHEVEQVCDRVAIIRRGQMIEYGHVRDLVQRGSYLEITLPPDEAAVAAPIISAVAGVTGVQPGAVPGHLIVLAPTELGRDINRALASQGIYATAITPRVSTLEDVFLELTEGSAPGEHAPAA